MATKQSSRKKGQPAGPKNRRGKAPSDDTVALSKQSKKAAGRANKVGNLQQGRQQGAQTGREAYKSNSQDFFRHAGQGPIVKRGAKNQANRVANEKPTGSDTRKFSRPKDER